MRRAVLLTATAVLLLTPTVLAFFSGGYFDEPRLIATLTVWSVVLLVAVAAPRPLPASAPGRAALAGLALLTIWTAASVSWAPLSDPATDSAVRLVLYLGAFVAAAALLRDELAARAVEPALAAGALVVIGYGLSERLLPGLVDLAESAKAFGRLEQPITYWNAEGALAAIGLVLCARLAGARDRPTAVRALAAAAAVPLGLGVYLSYSRGAIAAALVGLVVLLAAAPTWSQLRADALAVAGSVVAAACAAAFSGVSSLSGSLGDREADGRGHARHSHRPDGRRGRAAAAADPRRGARHGGDGAHASGTAPTRRGGGSPRYRPGGARGRWARGTWPQQRPGATPRRLPPRLGRVASLRLLASRASTPTARTRYAALEQAAFEWNGFESVRSARVPSRCTRFRSRCSWSWGCPVCSGSR